MLMGGLLIWRFKRAGADEVLGSNLRRKCKTNEKKRRSWSSLSSVKSLVAWRKGQQKVCLKVTRKEHAS